MKKFKMRAQFANEKEKNRLTENLLTYQDSVFEKQLERVMPVKFKKFMGANISCAFKRIWSSVMRLCEKK